MGIEISKYIVIWLAIAALAASFVWISIKFVFAVIRSRRQADKKMSWDECRAYANKIQKQYPDEPKPEQVAERPHVEMKGSYNDQKQVIEWGEWEGKSVLK